MMLSCCSDELLHAIFLHDPRRVSHNAGSVRHITYHDGTRTYCTPFPYLYALNHASPYTNMCSLSDTYISSECHIRGNMHIIRDFTIVIYRGICVDNTMFSNAHTAIYRNTSHDYRTLSYIRSGGYVGRGVT